MIRTKKDAPPSPKNVSIPKKTLRIFWGGKHISRESYLFFQMVCFVDIFAEFWHCVHFLLTFVWRILKQTKIDLGTRGMHGSFWGKETRKKQPLFFTTNLSFSFLGLRGDWQMSTFPIYPVPIRILDSYPCNPPNAVGKLFWWYIFFKFKFALYHAQSIHI